MKPVAFQFRARILQFMVQLQDTSKGQYRVIDYFNKITGFVDDLNITGGSISSDDQIMQILSGFSVEYDSVVAVITTKRDELCDEFHQSIGFKA